MMAFSNEGKCPACGSGNLETTGGNLTCDLCATKFCPECFGVCGPPQSPHSRAEPCSCPTSRVTLTNIQLFQGKPHAEGYPRVILGQGKKIEMDFDGSTLTIDGTVVAVMRVGGWVRVEGEKMVEPVVMYEKVSITTVQP